MLITPLSIDKPLSTLLKIIYLVCVCSDSLINFPRRTPATSGLQQQQAQQPEQQQSNLLSSNHNGQGSVHATSVQLAAASNGIASVNNSVNAPSPSATSAVTMSGLLHQSSMSSRQENQTGTVNSPHGGGNTVQIPSASSSNAVPPSQTPNPSSPFPSPTPSSSVNNNLNPASYRNTNLNLTNSPANMLTTKPHEVEVSDSHSSVQQILQEMMMSSQLNGVGSLGDTKGMNGFTLGLNGANCLVGNGICGSTGISGMGFGGMNGISPSATTAGGVRAAMANNAMTISAVLSHQRQQDVGNKLSNLQFDWRTSPW